MRNIAIILVLLWATSGRTAEISTSLDRCVILNNQNDNSAESKIALHFALPREVNNAEIIFAEIQFDFPQVFLRNDSLIELLIHPIIGDWSENNIDYENSIPITDSVATASFVIKFSERNSSWADITNYIKSVSSGEYANFGLIMVINPLGDLNIVLPENLRHEILSQTRVKITYK